MGERKWTADQLAGISTLGKSLLVSAAAGAGKTAVLAGRCAYLVCDAPKPCDIDQLLVVTFTESAAAEMKARIAEALRQRMGENPPARLARQLALAEYAHVSTVHGFCAWALRQNFHLIGLDPRFQILDGDEAMLLRAEVARDLFDRMYEEEGGDFQKLIDAYGDGKDEGLVREVIATHELLCSLVDPAGWIARVNAEIAEAAEKPIETSMLGKKLITQVMESLTRLGKRCNHAIATVKEIGGFQGYVDQLGELLEIIRHWWKVLKQNGLDMLVGEVMDFRQTTVKAPTVKGNPPGKELAKGLLDSVKKGMKDEMSELLGSTSAQWREGMAAVAGHARVFLDLVEQFSHDYTVAKEAARALDFSDLERLTLNILREKDSKELRPSAVARQYHEQFKHVLVDEYQDINEIQDAILALVSRECVVREGKHAGNLFCVGDVKQSIFRFRLAEPGRFLERQERFKKDADGQGLVIDLRENFRSRAPLLEAINGVFERLMTREAAEIEYDQTHRLAAGRVFPKVEDSHFAGAPIELYLLPADLNGAASDDEDEAELERADYEAILIARRILQLTGKDGSEPKQVMKADGAGNLVAHNIGFGDIVILLRSMKFKADTFADVLRGHGIPVHSEGGGGFFAATEVRDILALLQILDNQQQDIPLAAVLRSPLAAIPQADDALARIRLQYPNEPEPVAFHEAVRRYAEEQTDELAARLRDFLAELKDWREMARNRPVAELLWSIYSDSGYLAFCGGLEDGPQRVANLIELHNRARQFGTFLRQGLYRFLRFLESLREEKELSRPSVASEAEEVVRIMSIHRSKGLEFPVVILPDLGKKHNLSDSRGTILVDRAAGLGMAVVDEARRIRYPSLASMLVKSSLLRQTLAEEMRLLYVAMTRAKEHLILVGTEKNEAMQRWLSQWEGWAGALPADVVLKGMKQLDWIGPVAAMTGIGVLAVRSHDAAEVRGWQNPRDANRKMTDWQKDRAALKALVPEPAEDEVSTRVKERLGKAYPFKAYAEAAAAVSVTARLQQTLAEEEAAPSVGGLLQKKLDLPKFLQDQTGSNFKGTDIGTITHLVLQHWDFSGDADIERQIEGMILRKLISREQSKAVDAEGILWLLKSEVGEMLKKAGGGLMREMPFAIAGEIDVKTKSDDPMDREMIRGRIDLLAPAGESLAVVDYKTDRVLGDDLEIKARRYAAQIDWYRKAVERATGRKIGKGYLVFLWAKKIWPC